MANTAHGAMLERMHQVRVVPPVVSATQVPTVGLQQLNVRHVQQVGFIIG